MYGTMRSLCVLRKMLLMNFNLHKRKTENAGKKAVIQNTLTFLRNNPCGVMPANSNGKRRVSHKKIYVGINKG
jgi:hypothetical protein